MEDSAGVIARPIAGLAAPPSVAALSGDVAAIPDHRGAGDVVVYGPGGACARLTGFHRARVTALCFFEDELLLRLYTVATDGLAAWAIQRGGAGPMQGPGMSVEGPETVVEESLDEVPEHLGVDAAGRRLVVCAGRVTRVVSLKSGKVLARLEGHGGNVVAAAFRGGTPRTWSCRSGRTGASLCTISRPVLSSTPPPSSPRRPSRRLPSSTKATAARSGVSTGWS